MEKIDLKKKYKELYYAGVKAAEPRLVSAPPLPYLMIDGADDPNTSVRFGQAIEALYGLAYSLKFALKKGPRQLDFTAMPLQGLWWAEDMTAFTRADRAAWLWRLMILLPEEVTAAEVEAAREALADIRFDVYEEGRAAQVLHLGPFDAEGPTIERLHDFIAAQGLTLRGKHHEIYLGDMRRTAPEKLKTILRQPVG